MTAILPDLETPPAPAVLVVPTTRDILAPAGVGELVEALHATGHEIQILARSAVRPNVHVVAQRGSDEPVQGVGPSLHTALAAAVLQAPEAITYLDALGDSRSDRADLRSMAQAVTVCPITGLVEGDPLNAAMVVLAREAAERPATGGGDAIRHAMREVLVNDRLARGAAHPLGELDSRTDVCRWASGEVARLVDEAYRERDLAEMGTDERGALAVGARLMAEIAAQQGIDTVVTGR